jgi:hypothetical protein
MLAVLLCACGPSGDAADQAAQIPRPVRPTRSVKPPTLNNRDEVIEYRDAAARALLPAGDSLTVDVYARIDGEGVPHQPEVKQQLEDQRLVGAAISVVQKMQFTPAQVDGQATSVLIKIPVRFVHPAGQ